MPTQIPLPLEYFADQTFDSYYTASNAETINYIRTCVKGDGEGFVYLWGAGGLGKTHLLHACCHLAQELQQSSLYLPLTDLFQHGPSILDGLSSLQIVCIDDIESISGHSDWEHAFFNFFNQSREQENRLIVAAHHPPNAIRIKLPDLSNRLSWGLTLRLQSFDDSDKVNALVFRAASLGMNLSPQVGKFLISHYQRDLPSLWKLLADLDRATLTAQRKLTIPFLKWYFSNHPNPE